MSASTGPTIPFRQTYPPPTELPAMRAGELDGRYMDCTPVLAPVGDLFNSIGDITITVARRDGQAVTNGDLQPAGGAWEPLLDTTGRIATFGWIAPVSAAGVTYLLTLSGQTKEGRTFVRDWIMSVVPLLG